MINNEITVRALEIIKYNLSASKHKEVIDEVIDVLRHDRKEIAMLRQALKHEAEVSHMYRENAEQKTHEIIKQFAHFMIDNAQDNKIYIMDIPDIVLEFQEASTT